MTEQNSRNDRLATQYHGWFSRNMKQAKVVWSAVIEDFTQMEDYHAR